MGSNHLQKSRYNTIKTSAINWLLRSPLEALSLIAKIEDRQTFHCEYSYHSDKIIACHLISASQ